MSIKIPEHFFIFDVESIGLHGEGFAVAFGIYTKHGEELKIDCLSCAPNNASEAIGDMSDRIWVAQNVPKLYVTHGNPGNIRREFWGNYLLAKKDLPDIAIAAECLWPVEARFLINCVDDNLVDRKWQGPYPFHEIATFMLCAGMDPMATYDRLPNELPKHCPIADVRQSARLLSEAIRIIESKGN